jgi:CO/xanthine dehydrogenase FAD-binding subunit
VLDVDERMTVAADQVILAIGQGPDLGYAGAGLATGRRLLAADPETGETALAGVFGGGDAAGGAATVVAAIASGRRAALALDRHLGGAGIYPARRGKPGPVFVDLNPASTVTSPPAAELPAPPEERSLAEEDRATLPWPTLDAEARRCFNCGGCVAVNAGDLAPALVALGATIRTTRRRLAAADFFAVGARATTALEPGELVREIEVPRPPPGTRQSYVKFRTRRSIDFPIAGVAAVALLSGGVVQGVRLALGAVAPVPLRATAAEEYLLGRRLDAAAAAEAAARAVAGAAPLGENRYKVTILKTLVQQALEALAE